MKGLGVVLAMLAFALPAQATLTLDIVTDGGSAQVVDLDNDGVVTWSGAIGDFQSVNVTGLSKPMLGSAESPSMDLNGVVVSRGTETITITLRDDGFTGQTPAFEANIGGTQNGTLTYETAIESTELTSQTFTGQGNHPFAGTQVSSIGTDGAPYSLTQVVTITGKLNTSFNATLTPVPEPMTVLLLGSGLVGLGLIGRKRRKA